MGPKFLLDGVDTEFQPGQTILDVCHKLGSDVPHYCWHPGLTIAGNCRICLVEVEMRGRSSAQIACNTQVSEGMIVRTQSEKARKDRQDVMELLLINHPLDCPICDQAGECKLQEYSFEIGSDRSRFTFAKVHKPKNVKFSDKVTFDAERCILCTRCVRFCDEIAGVDELAIVNRGDRNEIAVARGGEMQNPYQMNTIDICPVGALTSADFRFKSRVWFLKQTRSVCGSCSRGCNVTVGSRWNRVLRQVPAENEHVNQWWMCDDGRLDFRHVEADDRLGAPMVRKDGHLVETTWDEALTAAADGLRKAGVGVFSVVSARLTNEELYLADKILTALGTQHRNTKPRAWAKDDLLRTGDGNANTAGAALFGMTPGADGATLADLPSAGAKAAFLCGEDLDDQPELLAGLKAVPFVVAIDFHETTTVMEAAHVVLPGVTLFEKEGSLTNVNGRVQRVNPSVQAPGSAWPDWKILAQLREKLDRTPAPRSAGKVFEELAAERPEFAELTHGRLGPLGLDLRQAERAAAAASGAGADA